MAAMNGNLFIGGEQAIIVEQSNRLEIHPHRSHVGG